MNNFRDDQIFKTDEKTLIKYIELYKGGKFLLIGLFLDCILRAIFFSRPIVEWSFGFILLCMYALLQIILKNKKGESNDSFYFTKRTITIFSGVLIYIYLLIGIFFYFFKLSNVYVSYIFMIIIYSIFFLVWFILFLVDIISNRFSGKSIKNTMYSFKDKITYHFVWLILSLTLTFIVSLKDIHLNNIESIVMRFIIISVILTFPNWYSKFFHRK